MKRQNLDILEKKLAQKLKKREKRRKPRMKVNGAGVKRLQRIVGSK